MTLAKLTHEEEMLLQLTPEELEFLQKDRESNRKKHICKAKANNKAKKALKILTAKKQRIENTAFPEEVTRIAMRKKNVMKQVERKHKKD